MGTPDKHEPGIRIVQATEMLSVEMIHRAIAPLALIRVAIADVIKEVPGADFIEIRAVRFDRQEDNDERTTGPALPGPGAD